MLTAEGMEKNELVLMARTPTPTPTPTKYTSGLNEPDASDDIIDTNKVTILSNDLNSYHLDKLEAVVEQQSCDGDVQQINLNSPTKVIESCNSNNITCPFASHHYHYIDYPASYYQRKKRQNDIVAMSQNANSNVYHYCACSCSCESHMQTATATASASASKSQKQQQQQQQQQPQHDQNSRMAVSAIVHQQSTDAEHAFRTQSEQSLASNSYQALNVLPEKKSSSASCRSKLNIDSDVECNCATVGQSKHRSIKKCKNLNGILTESMLATADDITVSESDNNGSMTKRKNMRESRVHKKINSWYEKNYNCNHIEIYSDEDEVDIRRQNDATMTEDATTNILDQRPPLPPRPQVPSSSQNRSDNFNAHRPGSNSVKKYVIWCLICGGFSCLLGALFLGVYFLLHSYTITVGNFETVPTFVPATLLILTGICIMSLARRKNRYTYLIKLSGACGLITALTCALVTVTTTVLHMSRLQALRECEYAQKTRTCTCYSDMIESQVDRVDKEGVRLVFDSLSDCGVVHGSLYSCLRAIFGLSVAGVLTSVFSCMLVYQLLSHERKKMYWEQLELRCRSLYSTHQQQHPAQTSGPHNNMATIASIGSRNAVCRCCEQCHAHRQLQLQAAATYPWVDDVGEPRFWAGQPPGNFYSPNPCGEENSLHNHAAPNNRNRLTTGWSWPRMPWQRNSNGSTTRFRQVPSSPDSQYGFSSANASLGGVGANNVTLPSSVEEEAHAAAAMAAVAAANASQRAAQVFNMTANSNLPYGVWGPPPPYSDPNSPARRGFYQYMQTPSNICNVNRGGESSGVVSSNEVLQHRPLSAGALNTLATDSAQNSVHCVNQHGFERITQLCTSGQIESNYKSKEQNGTASLNKDYSNSCSDSDVDGPNSRRGDRFMNTLPTRKIKKRVLDGSGSIAKCAIPNSRCQLTPHRINVQHVFPESSNSASENDADGNGNPLSHCGIIKSNNNNINNNNNNDNVTCMQIDSDMNRRVLQNIIISDSVENNDFHNNNSEVDCQNNGASGIVADANCEDPTESEIYFADVSSCCNMSMKNGNCCKDCNPKVTQQNVTQSLHDPSHRLTPKRNQMVHYHQHQHSNCSQSSNASCCIIKDDHMPDIAQRENSLCNRQQQRQTESNIKKKINSSAVKSCNNTNDILPRIDNKIDIRMPKDSSMQSMCSIETECTNISPTTPCNNSIPAQTLLQCNNANNATSDLSHFISSFPEAKFHEAHRRFTKNMHDNAITTGIPQDAHYEVINDRVTTSSMSPQPQTLRSRNFKANCNISQGSLGRGSYGRNAKTKSHMDRPSDAGGGNRHRQRM